MRAHRARDVATQRHAVLEHTVGITHELDDVDADDRRSGAFLVLAQRAGLLGIDRVDAGLAAGGKQVADLLALRGPPRDGRGGPVLEIVGMRDDCQRA